jgi:hypothetical protein
MAEIPRVVPRIGNYIYIIKPTDTSIPKGEPIIGKLELKRLQRAVGGLIEIVPRFNSFDGRTCVAFCNEEGKMRKLQVNHLAHALWEKSIGRYIKEDYLVGNIVIIVGPPSYLENL